MKIILKTLKHQMIVTSWSLSKKNSSLDFFGEAMTSIAGRWHSEFETLTTYYALFDVLRQRKFSGSLFELGGGYSTILSRKIFNENSVKITSVDFFPKVYKEFSFSDAFKPRSKLGSSVRRQGFKARWISGGQNIVNK